MEEETSDLPSLVAIIAISLVIFAILFNIIWNISFMGAIILSVVVVVAALFVLCGISPVLLPSALDNSTTEDNATDI